MMNSRNKMVGTRYGGQRWTTINWDIGIFQETGFIYIYIDLLSNTHKSGNMIPTTEHSWDEPFHVAPPPNFSTRSLLFFSYDVFLVQLPPILLLVKSRFCLQVGDFSPDP